MTVPRLFEKYIGIPYKPAGFTATGCNCWGLVHLVLKQEAGIVTPTYAEISADQMVAAARMMLVGADTAELWPITARPRLFDVVLMTVMTDEERPTLRPGHVGIMVSDRDVLHTWAATAACAMPLTHDRIKRRIISFHRHRDLPP